VELARAVLDALEPAPPHESHHLRLQRLATVELSPADLDDGRVQRRAAKQRLHAAQHLQLGALDI